MNILDSITGIFKGKKGRREQRMKVRVPATVNGDAAVIVDLSHKGCGLYPDKPNFVLNQDVKIVADMKFGKTMTLYGRIVSSDEQEITFGVLFTKVPSASKPLLNDLIQKAMERPDNFIKD